jgi:apolipoprotein N-acyltransferase
VGIRRALGQPVRYAVLVSGAVPILAFPAANLEFLGWIGLVPGLALMRAAPTRREAAVRGWWFGTGYLLAAMYWLTPNLGPAVLLVAIVLGFLWTVVGLAVWAFTRPPVTLRKAAAALTVVPSAWLITEWIRSWQGIGGPWAVLGASQWQHPVFLALAAAGGVWLVTFALVAANTGILLAITAKSAAARAAGVAGVLIAVLAGPVIFTATAPPPVSRHVTIALVQPGLQGKKNPPGPRLAASERLTAASAHRADLYVWGESSVGFYLADRPAYAAAIEKLTTTAGAQILLNQDALNAAGATSKQAVLMSSTGVRGTYVKTRLVPFGEYIPFRSALGWLDKISKAAPANIVAGHGAHVLHATLPGGQQLTFGPLICFESAFPDMSRLDADDGAQLILYQTSDSTFQASWAPAQHAALGAVRAAETGRPVAQAALTGDSAAFDARGRQLAYAGSSYRGVLFVRLSLPPVSSRTLYDRLGDYVPWIATGIGVLAAAIGLMRTRRNRQTPGNGPGADTEARISLDSSRITGSHAGADHSSRASTPGSPTTSSGPATGAGEPETAAGPAT